MYKHIYLELGCESSQNYSYVQFIEINCLGENGCSEGALWLYTVPKDTAFPKSRTFLDSTPKYQFPNLELATVKLDYETL